MLTVEFDDHTEKYECYMVINDTLDSPYHIEKTGDDMAVTAPEAQPYVVRVYPKAGGGGISMTVPGKKNGHTVDAVIILSCSADAHPATGDDIKIKYLYIPSTVNYIDIQTPMINGTDPLNGCKVEISPDNPYFCVYKNGIYSKDMTELFHIFPQRGNSDGCFEVPAEVKNITRGVGSGLKGLRRLIVPESVNEIKEKAFEYCHDLEYADIRARKINSRAFCSCNKLKEVRLSEPLLKIEDHAFAYTDITKLNLPPSVRDVGHFILENADPTELTLEVYSDNGALPKFHGSPAEVGTLLVVRSSETNEKLCEFVILMKIKKMLTEHGIDLTKYDELFKKDPKSQSFSARVGLRAAQVRLSQLKEEDEEKRGIIKHYISRSVFYLAMDAIIKHPDKIYDHYIDKAYLDLMYGEDILRLIDQSARSGQTEITAGLMQYYHERKSHEGSE